GHGGDAAVGEAAGDDGVEPLQVRCAVQGEAVQGDARAFELHADRADLPLAAPHAGPLGIAPELDADVAGRADHDLLEHPEVPDHVGLHTEIDDRVADELARAVERHAAPA